MYASSLKASLSKRFPDPSKHGATKIIVPPSFTNGIAEYNANVACPKVASLGHEPSIKISAFS